MNRRTIIMLKRLFYTGLQFDWKITVITITSTLLVTVAHYHEFTSWKPYDGLILFLLIPMALTVFIFRENLREYGFRLGDWRAGLALTFAALVIMFPLVWFLVARDNSMRTYYQPLLKPSLPLYTFLDLLGWEFLFRGWILFGYARKFGPEALWLQAVPFAIAHSGKPEIETLSTIFGGFAFGWIAWRTKSFLYPLFIHWAIFTFVVLAAGGFFG